MVLVMGMMTVLSITPSVYAQNQNQNGFWEGLIDKAATGAKDLVQDVSSSSPSSGGGFEGLGRDIDNSIGDYQRGDNDGEEAGEDDYPNFDSDCPSGESMAYCGGYLVGYNRGFSAARTTSD